MTRRIIDQPLLSLSYHSLPSSHLVYHQWSCQRWFVYLQSQLTEHILQRDLVKVEAKFFLFCLNQWHKLAQICPHEIAWSFVQICQVNWIQDQIHATPLLRLMVIHIHQVACMSPLFIKNIMAFFLNNLNYNSVKLRHRWSKLNGCFVIKIFKYHVIPWCSAFAAVLSVTIDGWRVGI